MRAFPEACVEYLETIRIDMNVAEAEMLKTFLVEALHSSKVVFQTSQSNPITPIHPADITWRLAANRFLQFLLPRHWHYTLLKQSSA